MATSIKLDPKLKARVDALATAQRRSAHWIMREAIQQYVDREEGRGGALGHHSAEWAGFQEEGQRGIGEYPRPDFSRLLQDKQARVAAREAAGETEEEAAARRAAGYKVLLSLAGAGAGLPSAFKTAEEVDKHIRWLRGDD